MKKEELEATKAEVVKQLEELVKQESELAKKLEQTRANINAAQGALQYHEFIVSKLDSNNQTKETTPSEITEAVEVK